MAQVQEYLQNMASLPPSSRYNGSTGSLTPVMLQIGMIHVIAQYIMLNISFKIGIAVPTNEELC
jgi:hypothetical protein